MSVVYLVGVDCSDCGSRALEYAAEHASVKGAKLVVVHVIEWSPYSFSTPQENEDRHKRREEEIKRAHSEILDPIVAKYTEQGLDVKAVVRHGHVAETLLEIAKKLDVSDIIVGRQGSSRIKAQIFGSVASTLTQIADRPVTVVP